jgi:hypothetical protein
MAHIAEVKYVKGVYLDSLFAKTNVVGVGVGNKWTSGKRLDQLCIVVLVRQKLPVGALSESALVPREINGVITDVIEVGILNAQQTRTDRWRPIPGGVSIGHYLVTAGTMGCVVRDRTSNELFILSNNHVLGNSNQANVGDPILQPGAADGGLADKDIVARLERFVPISFQIEPPSCAIANSIVDFSNRAARLIGSSHRLKAYQEDLEGINQVDAAIARPVPGIEISDEILEIGVVGGTTPARLGMRVRKSGRTTGYTTGQVTVLDAAVDINYGDRVARFEGQIVTTAMSSPGDSGSLLVDDQSLLAVGLLFAGSDSATIHNPIQPVLDNLQVFL